MNLSIDPARLAPPRSAVPPAVDRPPAADLAPAAQQRVNHLFRTLTRAGLVHPLHHAVLQYRGGDEAPATPVAAAIGAGVLGTGTAAAGLPGAPRTTTGARTEATAQADTDHLLQHIQTLPALPQAALQALAALRDENTTPEHCAEQLGRDLALAARTLKLANSAFYGLAGRVSGLRDAVSMLGRRTLCSAVTALIVSEQLQAQRCEGFDFADFWRHAAGTAIAARSIARTLRLDEETAFTAGLLHDIAHLAMAAHFPEQLSPLLKQAAALDRPVYQVEEECRAHDHAELGARLIEQWRLPATVAAAVRHHHRPPLPSSERGGAGLLPGPPDLADVVHAADAIAHALDLSGAADESVPAIDLASWGRLNLKRTALPGIFAETEQGVVALCSALGL
jgi:putative nucleotidyltransferase with HDIG domain